MFLPFKKAMLQARSLKLKNMKEWKVWCKSGAREANMPFNPNKSYQHDGWLGHGHWLGTGTVGVKKDQQFLPFKEALLHARSLKLKNRKSGTCRARAEVGCPACPPAQRVCTSMKGGKGTGTGWALAMLVLKETRCSCRSRRRCCMYAP